MRKAATIVLLALAAASAFAQTVPDSVPAAASVEATPIAASAPASAAPAADPNAWSFDQQAAGPSSPASAYSPAGDMARLAGSLAAVLVVIAAAVWAWKRFAPRSAGMFSSEHLKVVARTCVGPRQFIYLVRAPGSLLILGATQERISLLTEVRDQGEIERTLGAVEASSAASVSRAFKSFLSGDASSGERDASADLAEAVRGVSSRFARLNSRLRELESGSQGK